MKFSDIVSNSDEKNSKFSKYKSSIFSFIVFVVVLSLFFVIYCFINRDNASRSDTPSVKTIYKDDVLVQTLYNKVHDFNSSEPFWMYQNERGSLISNMTESNKMSLVYINLKNSDISSIDCSSISKTFDNYTCSGNTKSIKLSNVDRVYRELFGNDSKLNKSAIIKADMYGNSIYSYIDEIDSYVLYTSKDQKDISDGSNYQYVLDGVDNSDSEIKIYEEITDSSKTSNNVNKYVYTFKLSDNGLYTYYSREESN